jgi:hypothetical protein
MDAEYRPKCASVSDTTQRSPRRMRRIAHWTIGALSLATTFLACKSSDDYAHITVDLSVEGLTPDQRALLQQIVIQSQPDGNDDPGRIYRVGVGVDELDSHYAYHLDYTPDPQSGTFVVSAELVDGSQQQLALKSAKAKVKPGTDAKVKLEFGADADGDAPCKPEGDPVELTTGPQGGESFAFLWDGDHYLVVYTDHSQGNGDLASVKLDANGSPISAPVFINASGHVSTLPSMVKEGDGYVVAWQEGRSDDSPPVTVQIRRLDADGNPVGNIRQIETTSIEARPVLATAYDKIALAWIDDLGTPAAPAKVAKVAFVRSDDFNFEGAGPVELTPDSGNHQNSFPTLAANDDGTLSVSWVSDTSSVYTATVGDDLAVSAPALLYTSNFIAQQTDLVGTGGDLFTAWEDLSGEMDTGRERIRGAWSPPDAEASECGIVHELYTGSANWPRLAWNGSSVAVVYYQYRDFGSQIYLTRYAPDGSRVDDADIQFTNVAGHAKYPDIVLRRSDLDGDHYGLGWISDHTGVQRVYFQPIVCER